jgi:hypothetical protein
MSILPSVSTSRRCRANRAMTVNAARALSPTVTSATGVAVDQEDRRAAATHRHAHVASIDGHGSRLEPGAEVGRACVPRADQNGEKAKRDQKPRATISKGLGHVHALMKANRSLLTWCLCVVHRPCGAPL